MSTFVKRTLSGAVLVIVTVSAIYFGGVFALALLILFGTASNYELFKALGYFDKEKGKSKPAWAGIVLSPVSYLLAWLTDYRYSILLCVMAYLIILLAVYVFTFNKYSVHDVALLLFGFVYTTSVLALLLAIRMHMQNGEYFVWMALVPAVCSDIVAYCSGMLFGKHHFSKVSPKKTIEGCVGGIIGAGLGTGLLGYYISLRIAALPGFVPACVVIGVVCGFISQIGDLAASAIKREQNIKDYGNAIPGHGGFLDRIDSILFITPIVFFGVLLLNTFYM